MSEAKAGRTGSHSGRQAIAATERRYLEAAAQRLERLRDFLDSHPVPAPEQNPAEWYDFLNVIKRLLGNFNHSLSLTATLLVKAYLTKEHADVQFDSAAQSHGGPGLDIDVTTGTGQRIVGAVKTLLPHDENDFGSQQKSAVLRDFEKLATARAEHKYLFLTAPETFDVVGTRYRQRVEGVVVVCLTDGRAFTG